MNKTNDKTNNYMGREMLITVDEKGIYRGYVQLDDNDDIFRLDYAEKMKIESLDDDWYVVVEPMDEYTNNRAWVENKCMDVINTLVEDNWLDDFDDDDDDWFNDDNEEDDYE
jgi:hypothetical protein